MAFLASLRSTIAYQTNGSTISTGSIYQAVSGVPVWTNTLVSSMVSIGQSTNQSYINLAQGNFSSSNSWVSTLNTASTIKFVSMSGNAQTQLAVSQVSTISSLYYTSTLGTSWATLSGASGLPTATQTNYSAGAVSGDGRYAVLGTTSGIVSTSGAGGGMCGFISNNYGASFVSTLINKPYVYLPFNTVPANGSYDASGNSQLTVTGSITSAPSYIIGTGAINMTNTAGQVASNYIAGTLTLGTAFTVSLWFNLQTLPPGTESAIVVIGNATMTNWAFQITYIGGLGLYVQFKNSDNTAASILVAYAITANTWYNIVCTFQASGMCYVYINNIQVASLNNTQGINPITIGTYYLGSGTVSASALNGYIDDFRIYNNIFTYPMNYNNVALSNSGTYMLATVANGGLFMSSNAGSTWSQVTSELLAANWSSLAISATGQYMLAYSAPVTIQPQLTGLTGAATVSYTVNGVNWTVSSSSNNGASQSAFKAFNNTTGDAWLSDNALQRYSAAGVVNANAATTSVIGVGIIAGEYLQVQSSVPIVMYSFALGLGLNPSPGNAPKTYYIIGSNDSVNWYTLQTGTTNITTLAGSSGYIIINQSGVQALSGTSSGNITTVAGAYATNPYTYFRLIGTSLINGGASTYMEIGEWFINFTAGGQAYSANFGSTWQNGYALATPSALSLSGSGQYALGATSITNYVVSNYLAGFSTGTYSTPTFSPVLNASTNIPVASAISTTGQYMVLVTTNTSGANVYYSNNYGANFTGLTIGSTPMTTCAISADGSYITVSNGTTVYQLNNNSNGFSLALGNNAGVQNQGLNAIAIGNYAGQINQSANSIVLNASGSVINPIVQGFYVAPIAQYTTSSATLTLLAYGTDNQVVQHGSLNLNNTFIGYQVGNTNSPGNTFLGAYAGQTAGNVYNTCIGTQAGQYNNGAYMNTFVGYQAGQYNNSTNTAYGNTNVFVGYQAGQFNQNNYNTFIGTQAGQFNNSGAYNTFLGHTAGLNNTIGNYNTFVGYNAGYNHRTGVNNTLFGFNAGLSTTTGSSNTFIGTSAGQSHTTGGGNVCIGQSAGQYPTTLTTGSNNIYIGFDTAGSASGNSNEIVIGQGATGNGTNTITLGNSSNGKTILTGNVGIGITNPSSLLHVNGNSQFNGLIYNDPQYIIGPTTIPAYINYRYASSIYSSLNGLHQVYCVTFNNIVYNYTYLISVALRAGGSDTRGTGILSIYNANNTIGANVVTLSSSGIFQTSALSSPGFNIVIDNTSSTVANRTVAVYFWQSYGYGSSLYFDFVAIPLAGHL